MRSLRIVAGIVLVVVLGSHTWAGAAEEQRWSDADLVNAYPELTRSGGLESAIRSPTLPKEAPDSAFLEALAWFAAGTPTSAGTLKLDQADAFLDRQVALYSAMLRAKVETAEDNDYGRSRTWKVIQKLIVLRDAMTRPPHSAGFAYRAMPVATGADDAWEQEHTLRSREDFAARVCRSTERPVLVKFGNTNCTQCMLFELMGSVKEYSDQASQRAPLDVYKVWFGLRPDRSFAGRVADPERLDALAKAEGVQSSPTFIVYRAGRSYPCGPAFPDAGGSASELDACIARSVGEAPLSSTCAQSVSAQAR